MRTRLGLATARADCAGQRRALRYRLRQRLGGSRPVVDAIPPRPPGMGQKTYARLRARVERLEKPLVGSRVLRYAPRWIAPLAY